MPVLTDDQLIDEFLTTVKRDQQVKQEFIRALRAKDHAGLREAVKWVVENLVKPGARKVWDSVIRNIVDWIQAGW
jgi:hypothetical protein